MKIDKIIRPKTLPTGKIRVAAIRNRHLGKRRTEQLKTIPHGWAKTRDLYTGSHLVILESDAEKLGWPVLCRETLVNA